MYVKKPKTKEEIKERIKFWKAVKEEFIRRKEKKDPNIYNCICGTIDNIVGKFSSGFFGYPQAGRDLTVAYPEAAKYKPRDTYRKDPRFWWSPEGNRGYVRRLAVLDSIILELQVRSALKKSSKKVR